MERLSRGSTNVSCEGTSTFDLSDGSLMKIFLETPVEKVAASLIKIYLGVGVLITR